MLSFTYYCLINYVYKFAPLQRLLSNDKSKNNFILQEKLDPLLML